MPRTRTALATIIAGAVLVSAAAGCGQSGDEVPKQSGTLVVLPQISAAGDEPQSSKEARTALVATFEPAVAGRKIAVQRKQGSSWKTVDEAEQGKKQTDLEFSVPYATDGEPGTYRAVASGAGGDRTTTESSRTDVHGAPDFTDEFSGDELDRSVWNTRDQGYLESRMCSRSDDRGIAVGDGTLKLSVLKDPDRLGDKCTYKGKKYSYRLSGHVGTVEKRVGDAAQLPTKTMKYGYFAARMKMQSGRGQHSSFWLQTYMEPGPAPTSGAEIDVVEYFGDDHPQGGVASYTYPEGEKVGGMIPDVTQYGDDWSEKFHVFSIEWTPKRYIFRIDGKETLRVDEDIVQVPEFLILSLLPSDWELPLADESELPQTAEVDWVRHWKL